MPAYLIARVHVHDPDTYANYTALSPAIIKAHGGRFLARSQAPITLEGPADTRRTVVVEFPDVAQAQAFYESAQYQAAKAIREPASEAEFIVVLGFEA